LVLQRLNLLDLSEEVVGVFVHFSCARFIGNLLESGRPRGRMQYSPGFCESQIRT
jgi:hypothetical protein